MVSCEFCVVAYALTRTGSVPSTDGHPPPASTGPTWDQEKSTDVNSQVEKKIIQTSKCFQSSRYLWSSPPLQLQRSPPTSHAAPPPPPLSASFLITPQTAGIILLALFPFAAHSARLGHRGAGSHQLKLSPLAALPLAGCLNDCGGNGICDEGICRCEPGFAGADCTISLCVALNRCNGHGRCGAGGKCFCDPGWRGDGCTARETCPSAENRARHLEECAGNGVCHRGRCFCAPGYSGADCAIAAQCAAHGCSGNGVCDRGVCVCQSGWSGPGCETLVPSLPCPNRNCAGEANGICRQGKCYCNPDWSGPGCERASVCPIGGASRTACAGQGRCAYGKCHCNPGWQGSACTAPVRCVNDCAGHGRCEYGKCFCDPGWSGKSCGAAEVCALDCSDNGICHHGACYCNSGFHGPACAVSTSALNEVERLKHCSSGCSGHGICGYGMSDFQSGRPLGRCLCQPGWTGRDCEAGQQCPARCSDHGRCVEGACVCECGWSGRDCSKMTIGATLCPNGCSSNGECVLGKCFCFPGYGGKDCGTPMGCLAPPPSSGVDGDANDASAAAASSSLASLALTTVPCSAHGECKWGRCFCAPGWTGAQCATQDEAPCGHGCSGHGLCLASRCYCEHGFVGATCGVSTGAVRCLGGCGEHGACHCTGGHCGCACDEGWGGKQCTAHSRGAVSRVHRKGGRFSFRRIGSSIVHALHIDSSGGLSGAEEEASSTFDSTENVNDAMMTAEAQQRRRLDSEVVTAKRVALSAQRAQRSAEREAKQCASSLLHVSRARRAAEESAAAATAEVERAFPSSTLTAADSHHHGYCVTSAADGGVKCQCEPGWEGAACDVESACPGVSIFGGAACSGRGECSMGRCFCYPGYHGDACEETVQCPAQCAQHGGGLCVRGRCICPQGVRHAVCATSVVLGGSDVLALQRSLRDVGVLKAGLLKQKQRGLQSQELADQAAGVRRQLGSGGHGGGGHGGGGHGGGGGGGDGAIDAPPASMLTAKSRTALNGRRRSTAFGAVAAVLLALVVGLLIGLFAKWFSGRQARGVCVCVRVSRSFLHFFFRNYIVLIVDLFSVCFWKTFFELTPLPPSSLFISLSHHSESIANSPRGKRR